MDTSIRNVLNHYYHHPQQMRHEYNEFIRTTDLIDSCIDFDLALRDLIESGAIGVAMR